MIRIETCTSADQPSNAWDTLTPRDRVTLDRRHLRAIERAGVNGLSPYYLVARDDDQAVGIAHCFAMDMDLAFLQKGLGTDDVSTLRTWQPGFLKQRIVECGLVSALGEGIVAPRERFDDVCRLATREMERIGREERADFILIRDVPLEKLDAYASLREEGYVPLLGFPIATMPIRWSSFDDYLAALKSDARWRLRRHWTRQTEGLEIETIQGFGQHAGRLAELWRQTHARSKDYSHEELNEAYFVETDRQLGADSHVVAIKKHGEIIAFCLSFVGASEYSAHHAGLDYSHCADHNLHFVLLLALLREAIARGSATISMGITAYDSKFMLGFEAEPVVYFVRHLTQPELTAAIASGFQEAIKPPPNTHRPFKGPDPAQRPDQAELAIRIGGPLNPSPSDAFAKIWSYQRINKFRLAGLYSFYPPFESAQGPTLLLKGKPVVMLGSNAYLGLGTHPRLAAAAKDAIDRYGTGCSGSPLLNGTLDIHVDLARSLAEFVGKEDALLFSTGYQTNVGVVSALLAKDDVLVMDKLDHASLVDGGRMAHVEVARFRHNDLESLEKALNRYPGRGKLVVVDSVFSMEGTISDLPGIVQLARRYGARILVDEAHAIGVLGPGGRGATEHFGLLDQVDLIMGTFSKSFASIGGFVAGDARVIDCLRHTGRSHIFSASLPPPAVAAVRAALEIIKHEPGRRARTLANARAMSQRLEALGYHAPYRGTAIVPVHCGHELLAFGLFKELLDRGVFVNPVAEPAVPRGRELLRTSYMATHTEEMLDRAAKVFAKVRTSTFPKRPTIAVRVSPARPSPLQVRPMVFLPVANVESLGYYYVSTNDNGLLRIPGFTRLEVGQAVDCGISFGAEAMLLQPEGVVVSRAYSPSRGRPSGVDVELLPNQHHTRELIERLMRGERPLAARREMWRYHASIEAVFAHDGTTCVGLVDDISSRGVAVHAEQFPGTGSRLPLLLRGTDIEPIEIQGDVRWERRGARPVFGVHFVFADPAQRRQVAELLGRIKASIADDVSPAARVH